MTKKILAYMDFMCPTGFGTVSHNVMDRLTPWFKRVGVEVDVACLNYGNNPSQQYNEQIMAVNPKMFARNEEDYYYRDGILKMLQVGDYDLLWCMNDVPVLGPMSPILRHLRQQKQFQKQKEFKMLMYTPIDSVPFARYFKDLDVWDEVYTYTDYGRREAEKAFQKVNKRKMKVGIIPHGMDRYEFQPLFDKASLRNKYDIPQDMFVFGNINKNQPRKDVGTTLLAFAEFKKWFEAQPQNPNMPTKVGLYLHCYHSDKTGIKLYVACERLDLVIGKDVFLPIEDKYNNNAYSTQEINEVYNCMDAFVSTTTAEGWGLTITEAMSVGLPIICGNHTSLTEITDNGELVYIVNDLIPHFQIEDAENVRMVLNPKAVTEQMINVYQDAPLKKVSIKNYQHKFAEYNWDKIADQWKVSIKRLLKL